MYSQLKISHLCLETSFLKKIGLIRSLPESSFAAQKTNAVMKNLKNKFAMLLLLLVAAIFANANNIRVSINSYNPTTKVLNVNLAWDHSWHDGSGTFRDAAWIFVKYKDVTDVEWKHASLSYPTGANYVLTDTLNSPGVKFDIIPKGGAGAALYRGAIIRRKCVLGANQNAPEYAGVYNVALPINLTLASANGQPFINPEFKVFALEMVDIPTSAFYIGDGSTGSSTSQSIATSIPLKISSEAATPYIFRMAGSSTTLQSPATFPKGQAEFFLMKYELSNEGYAEFINCLTRAQQNTLVNLLQGNTPSYSTSPFAKGYWIMPDPLNISAATVASVATVHAYLPSHPYINSFHADTLLLAYLDWAGMRPMTGFEYEKACRGPVTPVAGEYAWGTPYKNFTDCCSSTATISHSYEENETLDQYIDAPWNVNHLFRCGAFARDSGSTRLNSSGTYYGVMDMATNVPEVTVGYGASGSQFVNNLGDGSLTPQGYADVVGWGNISWQQTVGVVSQSAITPWIDDSGIRGVIK